MISAKHKMKVVVIPFWGLGLLPLGMSLRSVPHVLVKIGKKKELLISNECKLEGEFVIVY